MKLEDEGDVGTDASVQISTNVISVIYPSGGVLSAVFLAKSFDAVDNFFEC